VNDTKGNTFTINIGDPKSDANVLLYGFEPPVKDKNAPGGCYRSIKEEAMIKIPLAKKRSNQICLVLSGPVQSGVYTSLSKENLPQKVAVRVNNHEIQTITIDSSKWEEVKIVVPPELVQKGLDTLELVCEHFYDAGAFGGSLRLAQVKILNKTELSSPSKIKPKPLDKRKVFFGDLHIHSTFSPCGRPGAWFPQRNAGSPEENYDYVREWQDFCCITDHAETMTEDDYLKLLMLADKYNQPGSFVSLYGYEWTSNLYGHKNIYSINRDLPLCRANSSKYDTPQKLWNALKDKNAITIPHHPIRVEFPANWDEIDNEMQPLVEIYSGWGSSEYYGNPLQETVANSCPGLDVQSALLKGHRLGFVGGSDGHSFKHKPVAYADPLNKPHMGLTGIWADGLNREEIFKALKNRCVYATTGVKIILDFWMNGYPMGTELKVNQYEIENFFPLSFAIDIEGTNTIAKIELLCNNQIIRSSTNALSSHIKMGFTVDARKSIDRLVGHDPRHVQPLSLSSFVNAYSMYFYTRVTQIDGHMAWSSPIWLTFIPGVSSGG